MADNDLLYRVKHAMRRPNMTEDMEQELSDLVDAALA